MKNYYSILGVDKKASQDEIKKAFRKLAMDTHPDKHPGDKAAEERFKEVNEAYSVIGDEQKRKEYDAQREGPRFSRTGGGFSWGGPLDDDLFDFFAGNSFGGFGSRRAQQRHYPDEDLSKKFRVKVTFREAYSGCKKDVSFERNVLCSECEGTGRDKTSKLEKCSDCNGSGVINSIFGPKACPSCLGKGVRHSERCHKCGGSGMKTVSQTLSVKIPAGAFDGMELRVRGMGDESRLSKSSGDLFFVISVPQFSEDGKFKALGGQDMETKIQFSLYELIMGTKKQIVLPDGNTVDFNIPSALQPGSRLKIAGKGFKLLTMSNMKSRGDLYVVLSLKIPQKLNDKQLELLKKFDESLKND